MSWSKRELINEAFAELALAGYQFDLTPEEMQGALRRLDSMMATWEGRGVRVGYAFQAGPAASDLDDDSGLPDAAAEPVYLNLAIRLAAGFGKQLAQDTRTNAKTGLDMLLRYAATPIEQQLPGGMPLGAGNRGRAFSPPTDESPLRLTAADDLDILPE